jgi:hypothetical protein
MLFENARARSFSACLATSDHRESVMSGRDFFEPAMPAIDGVRIGELIGFSGEGARPLVVYAGQPGGAALVARTVADLRGAHIGREVLLMFEAGDPMRPVIIGCLQADQAWPLDEAPAHVEADSDGQRLIVTAKEEIVLRCGQASITLTRAGKVLIRGTYVSSRSSGVNRLKGGSVQIN